MDTKNITKVTPSAVLFWSTNQAKMNVTKKIMSSSLVKLNNFFLELLKQHL